MTQTEKAVCDRCGLDLGGWLPTHVSKVIAEHKAGHFYVKCSNPEPKSTPKQKKPTKGEQERSRAQNKIDSIITDLAQVFR